MDDSMGQAYAQALLAIARVDREVSPEESARVRELVAERSPVAVDFEASFFEKMTPEALRKAVEDSKADGKAIAAQLIVDGIRLATTDGDLNSVEAHAILRFARALGYSDIDITGVTHELDEYLNR